MVVSFSRLGDNLLTLLILAALGYMIYQKMKGKDMLGKIRDRMGRIRGGGKDAFGKGGVFK